MKVSQYIKEYTNGDRITFFRCLYEVHEFFIEVYKRDKKGMNEEFEDVLHHLQLWLYWRFGIDGETWKATENSVKKFMDRKIIWNKIYNYVGLEKNVSGFCGNYNKIDKVINHLQKFGISKEKAGESYNKVVLKNL